MAMIKQYEKKNGERAWYFKTYLGINPLTNKKRYTTKRGFKTKKEAKIALSRLEVSAQNHELTVSQNSIQTFDQVYRLWYQQYKNTVKESTLFVQKNAIEKHILPNFGQLKLNKITLPLCQKIVNHWFSYYKKYSNLIGLTTRILDYGLQQGQIHTNPMNQVIRPKRSKKIDEEMYAAPFYNKEQLALFFKILRDQSDIQLFTMFRLLAFTGLRKGELQALRWSDINITRRMLNVRQTLAKNEVGKEIFQTPKTQKSIRSISLDDKTLKYLLDWRELQPLKLNISINQYSKSQLVFTDKNNKNFYLDYLNNFLKHFLYQNSLDKITVHGFRHTHCSLLFEAGVSLKEVQDRLGHSDIKTTMNIYTHVTEQSRDETADKFSHYLNF